MSKSKAVQKAAKKVAKHPRFRILSATLKAAVNACAEMSGGAGVVEIDVVAALMRVTAWGAGESAVGLVVGVGDSQGRFPKAFLRIDALRGALKGAPEWVVLESVDEYVTVIRPGTSTLKLTRQGEVKLPVLQVSLDAPSLAVKSYDFEWPLAYVDQAASLAEGPLAGVAWGKDRVFATDGLRAHVAAIPGTLTDDEVMPSAMAQTLVASINAFSVPMEEPVTARFAAGVFQLEWATNGVRCQITGRSLGKGVDIDRVVPSIRGCLLVSVAGEVFHAALQEARAALRREDRQAGRFLLAVEPTKVTLKVTATDDVNAEPTYMQAVQADGAPGGFTVCLNPEYLEEAIDFPEDVTVLAFDLKEQSTSPVIVRQQGSLERYAVVMPRRAAAMKNLAVPTAKRKGKGRGTMATVIAKPMGRETVVVASTRRETPAPVVAPVQQGFDLGIQATEVLHAAVQIQQAVSGLTRRMTRRHR